MQSLPTKLFSVALTCLFGTILIFWVIAPQIVNWQITKMIRLEEGNDIWDAWSEIEASINLKVYMFNITNPEEVYEGGLPKLVQLGPYVYEERRTKLDLIENPENDTITYQPKVMYYFRPELSNGTEDDIVTMLNVPLVAVADELQTWSRMIRYMAKFYLNSFDEKLIVHKSVKTLLFEGEFNEMIESVSNLLGREYLPNNTFGYFAEKNGTEPYRMEIFSGVKDNSKFGQIASYKGKDTLDIWEGEQCNMVNGSDNTIFSPFVTKDRIIYGFEPDICRSIHLLYQNEDVHEGIKGLKFVLPDEFFDVDYAENECYCTEKDKTKCPASGIVSVAPCKWGAPLYISNPHFTFGDPKYAEDMGLSPNPSEHVSYVLLEPNTGVVLKGNKRLQFNIHMKKSVDVPELYNVRDMVVPLIWIDEEAFQSPNQIDQLRWKLVIPLTAVEIGKWSLLALSTILTAIGVIIFMVRTRSRKPIEYY